MGRYQELQQQAASEAVMSATKRKEWLTRLIQSEEEETKDKLKAVDTLNKMTGEYLNKVEVSGTLKAEQSKLDDLIKQMSEDE